MTAENGWSCPECCFDMLLRDVDRVLAVRVDDPQQQQQQQHTGSAAQARVGVVDEGVVVWDSVWGTM